ncbi:transposase [Thiorhodospira sibirica]|uniref:transposase n=1 Tax=Thiorhodospira sibirica TaxID=154347 RepID=UPI003AB9B0B6
MVSRREQFEPIRGLLESGRKKTAPRRVDLYDVFCAVLYLLGTGCQWRALPRRLSEGSSTKPVELALKPRSV